MEYQNREDFSEELKVLLSFIEGPINNELPSMVITLDYFLLAILEKKDCSAYSLLKKCLTDTTLVTIHDVYYDKLNKSSLSAIRPNRKIDFSEEFKNILEISKKEINNTLDGDKLKSSHVLLSILNNETSEELKKKTDDIKTILSDNIRKVLDKAGANYETMLTLSGLTKKQEKETNTVETIVTKMPLADFQGMIFPEMNGMHQSKKVSAIESFCTNLNEQVQNGKMDGLIGREKEINEIIKVLCRRNKNNVILVGPDGCGKTAICKGLAYLIENGKVPQQLLNKKILMFNSMSIIAGTQFRGMFEERMNNLFEELKKNDDYILFIDDIASVFSEKQKSDNNTSSIWSSALEEGNFQILGTTSFKEYRNTFDSNPSIGHKFQKIVIEQPSYQETLEILNGIKTGYEKFHGVKYTEEAIENCVRLAENFITDRNLPDSAIDLMDESGSYINIISEDPDVLELKRKVKKLEKEINDLKRNDKYKESDKVEKEKKKIIVDILKREKQLEKNRKESPLIVEDTTILKVVSDKTNIPINKLDTNDKKKLSNIDKVLKKKIIGQDEAIEKVCKAIKRNRIGLTNNKTYASFLMIGKTGVGKTLLAKQLAKEIFGNENLLVRFDMSEYSDKTSVTKLIGSNPGYIGYENGGLLTESIKNKKHCVLLLDEIEKADKEVYNLFLQVFDEGFLTDNAGQKIDFKNVIIIITSNAGAKTASAFGKEIGFNGNDEENRKNIISKEVKKKFPPEFLNRLNGIIYFNSLKEDDYKNIIRLELDKVADKLSEMGYTFEYDKDVINTIYPLIEKEKEYGARPVLRAIQDEIEDKITDLIISSDDRPIGFVAEKKDNSILVKEKEEV